MSRYTGVPGGRSTPAQKAARREVIVKLARQGVATKNIIRQVNGTNEQEVRRIRREEGLNNTVRPPITAEQIERARQLMLDGTSRSEAARSVGATDDQLKRALPDLKGWTREQMIEAEHATGKREYTSPVITPSTSRPERYGTPEKRRELSGGFLPERPTEGPFS